MAEYKPCSVWPVGSFIAEEMQERGWTCVDVAARMPGDYSYNIFHINFLLCIQDEKMIVTDEVFSAIGDAFGIGGKFFKRLHETWLRNPEAREPFECPEELLDGIIFPANDATAPQPIGD